MYLYLSLAKHLIKSYQEFSDVLNSDIADLKL